MKIVNKTGRANDTKFLGDNGEDLIGPSSPRRCPSPRPKPSSRHLIRLWWSYAPGLNATYYYHRNACPPLSLWGAIKDAFLWRKPLPTQETGTEDHKWPRE